MAEWNQNGCQWVGPEQDPQLAPLDYCGNPIFLRSYCHDHVWKVYKKGSGINNKKKIKELEKEFLGTEESNIDSDD